MSASDNPAAFPCTGEGFQSDKYTQHGMTLRDWFAGQVIAGLMAAEAPDVIYEDTGVAYRAFRIADAMLAARKTGGDA